MTEEQKTAHLACFDAARAVVDGLADKAKTLYDQDHKGEPHSWEYLANRQSFALGYVSMALIRIVEQTGLTLEDFTTGAYTEKITRKN